MILLLFHYYRREYLFICVYLVSICDTSFYRYLFVLITYIYINTYDDDLRVTLTILSTIIVVINKIDVVIVIIIAITFASHCGRRNWIIDVAITVANDYILASSLKFLHKVLFISI